MKKLKNRVRLFGLTACLVFPILSLAADAPKAKAYPLKVCIVSDEKLGEMGQAYVFTHEGREIKLCCKGCLKEFNKDSAKYIKKLEEAEKKAK
jgi:hypothetical protein